jgi:hypothetical protein
MRSIALVLLVGCGGGTTSGDECTSGGARACDGQVTLMCLCEVADTGGAAGDAFADPCFTVGHWTPQETLCETCADWIDDACPIE